MSETTAAPKPRNRLRSCELRERRRALLAAIERRAVDNRRGRFTFRGAATRPPSTGELVEAFVASRPAETAFSLDELYAALHDGRSLDALTDWRVKRARMAALVRVIKVNARPALIAKYGDWGWLRYDRRTKLWYTRRRNNDV